MSSHTTSRLEYIGGSDIVALMGFQSNDEYSDWTHVWNRFRHKVTIDLDNGQLDRGNAIEPYIEAYIREHIDPTINSFENFEQFDIENDLDYVGFRDRPAKVFAGDGIRGDHLGNPFNLQLGERAQIFAQDKKQPYLCGHVDGIGKDIVHEMKAPKMSNIARMQGEGFKLAYIIQCQFYMMITGKRKGMIHVWDYDNWKPITLEIKRDEELHEQMRIVTKRFWEAVQNGDDEFPAPVLQRRMGYTHMYDHSELDVELAKLYNAREEKKRWDKEEKALKPGIMSAVRSIWQPDSRQCKFTTRLFKITASESFRGDTLVTRLTIKQNDIKKKVTGIED